MTARRLLPLLASLALAAPAPAVAAPKRPLPSRAQAVQALERAVEAKRGTLGAADQGHGAHGRQVTIALRDLAAALPALSGADRREAERVLARPTDYETDPQEDGYKRTSVLQQRETEHFVIHYVKAPPGDPDATEEADVDAIAATLEQNFLAQTQGELGWRPPPGDEGRGGNDKVDVYLKNLLDRGIFGYVALDPGQPSSSSVPHFSYMVLDNGYTEAGSSREAIMQVTAAHEYNHVLQNGYDYLQDTWMFESSAVWVEEVVYPAANDYLRYLGDWVKMPHVPLAAFRLKPDTGDPDENSGKAYGSAVWNHWLSSRFGREVIREAWERSPSTGDFAPSAFDATIAPRGGGGFAEEFERFAAQTAEWRAPGSGMPDQYPDVARSATVAADGSRASLTMDHTSFQHLDVPVGGLSTPTVQASALFPDGVPGAVALVGRTGGDTDGAVVLAIGRAPGGGLARVRIDDPTRFARLTAVVIDSDSVQFGFDSTVQDWVFRDALAVTASIDSARAPSGNTAEAVDVKDKSATLTAALAANVLDTSWRFEYGRTDRYGSTVRAPAPLQNGNVPDRVTLPVTKLRPSSVYHYRVVAENALGTFTGGDRFLVTEDDVTRPVFRLRTVRSARRSHGIPARVRCDEACRVSATVTIDRRTARRLGVPRTLARGRLSVRAETTKAMRVRLPRAIRAKLARARTLRATVAWRAADEFGNTTRITRKLALRR